MLCFFCLQLTVIPKNRLLKLLFHFTLVIIVLLRQNKAFITTFNFTLLFIVFLLGFMRQTFFSSLPTKNNLERKSIKYPHTYKSFFF